MFKRNLLIISVLTLLVVPSITLAVDVPGLPIVFCGTSSQDDPNTPQIEGACTRCDLFKLLNNIINFTVGGLMPPVAILLFVWAGFLILLGGANTNLVAQGRQIFTTTFFGIIIMLSAWMITNTLIQSVGAKYDNSGTWWQFTCEETVPATQQKYLCNQNNQCVADPNGNYTTSNCDNQCQPPVEGPPPTGNCTGVQCSDSNLNVCGQNTSANCSESAVNQWDSQIRAAAANNQVGSGINTVALIKAIISQESGGRTNINASDGLSYGIMQLRPETANQFKSGCTSANITPAWLNDSNNVQASVCIAINYLKSLTGSCGTSVRNLAAGYNGGGAAKGACDASQSCASCSVCGTEITKRWECLWDGPDGEHRVCNVDRAGSSFNATRKYVPKVSYCFGKFGGAVSGSPGGGSLTLSSIEPATFPAGTEKSFNEQTGVVEYTYLEVPFEVKGTGLTGATLESNNTGVDNKPGIEFKNLQITDTSIKGTMLMHSTAKDGKTTVTVRNSQGQTATKDIDVTITGTQYLKRKFADNPTISFIGNFRRTMYPPDPEILDLEKGIRDGLRYISGNAYRPLNIKFIFYENSYWQKHNEEKICYVDAWGCADRMGNIYVFGSTIGRSLDPIETTIFHEAVHQLHFYHIGEFRGIPNPPPPSNFQKEWDSVVGRVDESTCDHLPLKDLITWKDGHADEPECSFIWAYGAYLKPGKQIHYEDPTTMAQYHVFRPEVFRTQEVRNDPRYNNKVQLLKRYNFVQ